MASNAFKAEDKLRSLKLQTVEDDVMKLKVELQGA